MHGGGEQENDIVNDIAHYPGSEYYYVTGHFSDSLRFGNRSVFQTSGILFPRSQQDMFLIKYHISGGVVWAKRAGGVNGPESGHKLAVDSADNVYVAGHFFGDFSIGGLPVSFPPIISQAFPRMFIAKLSPQGNGMWIRHDLENNLQMEGFFHDLEVDTHGDVYAIGTTSRLAIPRHTTSLAPFIIKMEGKNGNFRWVKQLDHSSGSTTYQELRSISLDKSGNLFLSGFYFNASTFLPNNHYLLGTQDTLPYYPTEDSYMFVAKIDTQTAAVDWVNVFADQRGRPPSTMGPSIREHGVYFSSDHLDSLYLGGVGSWISIHRNFLVEIDANGTQKWIKTFPQNQNGLTFIPQKIASNDKKAYLAGLLYHSFTPYRFDSTLLKGAPVQPIGTVPNTVPFVAAFDSTGYFEWATQGYTKGITHVTSMIAPAGQVVIGGSIDVDTLSFGSHFVPQSGIWPQSSLNAFIASCRDTLFSSPFNTIRGLVYQDSDSNCVQNVGETPLPNMVIRGNGPRYAMTDAQGKYSMLTDTGTFELEVLAKNLPFVQFTPICPSPTLKHTVTFPQLGMDTSQIDYGMTSDTNCISHHLIVRITPRRGRTCTQGYTLVDIVNIGIDTAHQTQVSVQYPDSVIPLSANYPWVYGTGNQLFFSLGKVAPGANKQIRIRDYLVCGTSPFTSLCFEALVTPIDSCKLINPNWSGADLTVDGDCLGQGITYFSIKNEGNGHMSDSSWYQVIIDDTLRHQGKFLLNRNDSLNFQVAANGRTVKVLAKQVFGHPNNNWVSHTVEFCRNGLQPVSTGFVMTRPNQFPTAARDISCSIAANSYDPNDKQAEPIGVGPQHLIINNTRLSYRIRFQNTGNDTAFKIVLVDTLPPELDPASIWMEGGSHPYQIQMSGLGRPVLSIIFDPIQLPDSGADWLGSQGFIRFSIDPYDSLPVGRRIENFADIYFDFNSPIRTNTIFHTITDSFPEDLLPGVIEDCKDSVAVFAGIDQSFCAIHSNDTIRLNGSKYGNTLVQWQFLQGNGAIADNSSETTYITQLSLGQNQLILSALHCGKQIVDTLSINQIQPPAAPQINASGPLAFCEPDSVMLYAPAGFATYTWSTGQSDSSIIIKTSGQVWLKVFDTFGCESPQSNLVSTIFRPRPQPPLLIPSSTINLCEGDSVSLQGTGSFNTFQWNTGDNNPQLSVTQNGVYTLKGTNNFGCESLWSDSAWVHFFPFPAQPVFQYDNTRITGTNILASNILRWFDLLGPVLGENRPAIFPPKSGSYFLELTQADAGCKTISDTINFILTGLEPTGDFPFAIYPQPVQDGTLWITGNLITGTEISLVDVTGKVVFQEKTITPKSKHRLHLTQLSRGSYFIRIRQQESQFFRKIIVKN